MWKSNNPLAAFCASWTGSSKAKSRHFEHRKGGPVAAARANVRHVHRQVAKFEESCVWHNVDETDETRRCVSGFFAAVRYHERTLTGYSEENVEAMDSLERVSNDLVAAASTLYAIDPTLYQAKVGVSLLAGVRGLDSKEAFAQYLADLKKVAEDRRERAAQRKKVLKEGYTDRRGKEHSPADIAAKAERGRQRDAEPGGRDVALASRTSAGGQGLQNEEANKASMRSRQDRDARRDRRGAIDAEHKARNALPPPRGAERVMRGYAVRWRLVPPGELNPATWDRAEIERRVAEFRERLGVPERVPGTYVRTDGDGYRVVPPRAELRKLGREGKAVYNEATRSCTFLDKDEAVTVYEKFMAPSTSDVERKAMLKEPPEAYTCAHCGEVFKGSRRVRDRKVHESSCAPEPSSSSEEESEEEDSEEVAAPPPKRARFFSWPWGSSE